MRASAGIATGLAVVALGVGAYVWQPWAADAPVASPSPSPSPTVETRSLSFDPDALNNEYMGEVLAPVCGEPFAPEPVSAHGITLTVSEDENAGAPGEPWRFFGAVFATTEAADQAFLAANSKLVITRDGIVVFPAPDATGPPYLEITMVRGNGNTALSSTSIGLSNIVTCENSAAMQAIWDGMDWDNATDEQRAEFESELSAFESIHGEFPAGEYAVYAWTPLVYGEQAAVGAALIRHYNIQNIYDLFYYYENNNFVRSAEIAPYCSAYETEEGYNELECYIPDDVMAAALTLDVPVADIYDREPVILISEPYRFTVE